MQIDLKNRQQTFSTVIHAVEAHGGTWVWTGDWDAISVTLNVQGSARPLFSISEYGGKWFVTFPGSSARPVEIFRITDAAGIATTLLKTHASHAYVHDVFIGQSGCIRSSMQEKVSEQLQAKVRLWREHGWMPLSRDEEKATWKAVEGLLPFFTTGERPSNSSTWDISSVHKINNTDAIESNFANDVLTALQTAIKPEDYIHALIWDTTCYRFFPHKLTGGPYSDYWAVSPLPLYDNCYFIDPKCELGLLGKRGEWICIFGKDLERAFDLATLKLLAQRPVS